MADNKKCALPANRLNCRATAGTPVALMNLRTANTLGSFTEFVQPRRRSGSEGGYETSTRLCLG
jgi:hypothetical protein